MTDWYSKRPQDFTAEQTNICAVIGALTNRVYAGKSNSEIESLWSLLEAAEEYLGEPPAVFHCKSCGSVRVTEIEAGRCKISLPTCPLI